MSCLKLKIEQKKKKFLKIICPTRLFKKHKRFHMESSAHYESIILRGKYFPLLSSKPNKKDY